MGNSISAVIARTSSAIPFSWNASNAHSLEQGSHLELRTAENHVLIRNIARCVHLRINKLGRRRRACRAVSPLHEPEHPSSCHIGRSSFVKVVTGVTREWTDE